MLWRRDVAWWPDDLSPRAGILFMVGSACFALGSVPLFFLNAAAVVVGTTFFVGSIFFTSAGFTQLTQTLRTPGSKLRDKGFWAVVIQLIGMFFFNVNTFRAAFADVPAGEVNRLVWAPDVYGSIAFLVASHLAWIVVCGRLFCIDRDSSDWWMAALNYIGSIFFMLAAIASFTIADTGDLISAALTNLGTFIGAACFFTGGYLLFPEASKT